MHSIRFNRLAIARSYGFGLKILPDRLLPETKNCPSKEILNELHDRASPSKNTKKGIFLLTIYLPMIGLPHER
jgi:hypothetical protein